jgi:beta-phosphoglucomutase-like phosphatase (HAD superfamily)
MIGRVRTAIIFGFDGTILDTETPEYLAWPVVHAGSRACDPAAALAVEDSPNGITAAKAAGLFCVAVPNPMTVAVPNPMTAAFRLAGADPS